MLKQLGKLIEEKPRIIIGIVMMVTISFSSFIPNLTIEPSLQKYHKLPKNE